MSKISKLIINGYDYREYETQRKSVLAQCGVKIRSNWEQILYPNETCEEKMIRYQNTINRLLKARKYTLIKDNKIIMYINKQDIHKGIQYYLETFKNKIINVLSDVYTNKRIVDPSGNHIFDITNIHIEVSEINDWILNKLNRNPIDLYKLSSRRFEELIAEILIRKGYKVELTPATRDGGKDIYAARKDDLGSLLYIVECKKYKPTHKVGIGILRSLYGVVSKENLTAGIVVTTSYFTKPAQELQKELEPRMSLRDFNSVKQWLCDVT